MTACEIYTGDCLDVLRGLEVLADSVITDPPAGIGFMNANGWDRDRGGRGPWVAWLAERLAAARARTKPGGWAFIWALPRTAHWTGCAVEDAGWRIVDVVHHAFGQGWPKNKALLKPSHEHWILAQNGRGEDLQIDAGRVRRDWSERGEAWLRSGHSAKPGAPKSGGAPPGNGINANPLGSWPPNQVLSHCPECEERGTRRMSGGGSGAPARTVATAGGKGAAFGRESRGTEEHPTHRAPDGTEITPAFDCLAGCLSCGGSTLAPAGGAAPGCAGCRAPMVWACPVAEIDAQSGFTRAGVMPKRRSGAGYGSTSKGTEGERAAVDAGGGAARFFPCLPGDILRYQAKTPGAERDAGCEALLWRVNQTNPFGFDLVDRATWEALPDDERAVGNVHPTVKSVALLEWYCAVTTPPGGVVLDPFMGSGGTAIASHRKGLRFVGIDAASEAVVIARARLAWWRAVRLNVKPKRAPREATTAPAVTQATLFSSEGRR